MLLKNCSAMLLETIDAPVAAIIQQDNDQFLSSITEVAISLLSIR